VIKKVLMNFRRVITWDDLADATEVLGGMHGGAVLGGRGDIFVTTQ
jgi:hypothetical protein